MALIGSGFGMIAGYFRDMGLADLRNGDVSSSMEMERIAIALNPQDAKAHLVLGQGYLRNGQFDQAVAEEQTSIQLAPNQNPAAYLALGDAYTGKGEYAPALSQIFKAYQLNAASASPSQSFSANVINSFSNVLQKLGLPDNALRIRQNLVQENPTNASARLALGTSYINAGQYDKATEELQQVAPLNPNLAPEAEADLANIDLREGKISDAVSTLQNAIAAQPNNATLYADLGTVYTKNKQFDLARQQFDKARQLNPDSISNSRLEEDLDLDTGDFQGARQIAQTLVTDNPNNAQAQEAMAAYDIQSGNTGAAIQDAQRALQLNPTDVGALKDLAYAQMLNGNPNVAISTAQQALQYSPNDALALSTLGRAYYEKGQYDQAQAEAQKAISLNTTDAQAHITLAGVYLHNGQKDQAQQELQKANQFSMSQTTQTFYNQINTAAA